SLWSLEVIRELVAEGHPIAPGFAGENVTVEGLAWADVVPGVRLAVGEAVVEVVSFASPCQTIAHCFLGRDSKRISHKLHPTMSRVHARGVRGGWVEPNQRIVLEVPGPR